jgi:GNAT superfamily N-acetyltransferase
MRQTQFSCEIHEAIQEDLPSVLALYAQLEIDNSRALTLLQAQEILAKMSRYPDYRLYVALVGEQVVGSFALLLMDNIAHMGTRSGVIEDVVVAPDWQRKGIGTRMVKFAIDLCKEKGCYKLALTSNLQRQAAHAFYESLGFKRHGYSFSVDLS